MIPRRARRVSADKPSRERVLREPVELSTLRDIPAWVLLGEPGAGKSSAFDYEAMATGGLVIPVSRFIHSEDIDDVWQGKTLFLDGLDEARSATDAKALAKLISRLKKLGSPKFRIACRAADWFGQSDKEWLEAVAPNAQVYSLEPLIDEEIELLTKVFLSDQDHSIAQTDAQTFLKDARHNGASPFLNNPQSLKLLVKAIRGNQFQWPKSKTELYKTACGFLVSEENKKHRDRTRGNAVNTDSLLMAAGQLFATMLLAGKEGIALDLAECSGNYPCFADFKAQDLECTNLVLKTPLFKQSMQSEELLEPTHRSIAEYLGAWWLAKQLDQKSLPLSRVLNLLTAYDGKSIGSLRGLYAWLASLSNKARQALIERDSLSIALYGDPQSIGPSLVSRLLDGVRREINRYPNIVWRLEDTENIKALYFPELESTYLDWLRSPDRSEQAQSWGYFILQILKSANIFSSLSSDVLTLASDSTYRQRIRTTALRMWLTMGTKPEAVKTVLDDIYRGVIDDEYYELSGLILSELFPKQMSALEVLEYLRPIDSSYFGMFDQFWVSVFPSAVTDLELPSVLDHLITHPVVKTLDRYEFNVSEMLSKLTLRALKAYGDHVSDQQLFDWLFINRDKYGEYPNNSCYREAQVQIANWIAVRPHRYKGLTGECFLRSATAQNPATQLFFYLRILEGAASPIDIGLWHLEQIDQTSNQSLAIEHLCRAVRSLWWGQGCDGLTIDKVFEWAGNNEDKLNTLEPLLMCDMGDWRCEQIKSESERKKAQQQFRKENTELVRKYWHAIADGTAPPQLMDTLAKVWQGKYTNTRGDTPLERFRGYCEDPALVLQHVEHGMLVTLSRNDIPESDEIIQLYLKQRYHYIRSACLLGIELLWAQSPDAVINLSPTILRKLICFRITEGSPWKDSAWFQYLITQSPEIVSEEFSKFVVVCFKAKVSYIPGLSDLQSDPHCEGLAGRCIPTLIDHFPLRATTEQLNQLMVLLRTGLRYNLSQLQEAIPKRLKLRSIDKGQRTCFLFSGVLINLNDCEFELFKHVGASHKQLMHVFVLLRAALNSEKPRAAFSAEFISKLVELFTPHAQMEWPSISLDVTIAMDLGDFVRALIGYLAGLGTSDSVSEIKRLLDLPALNSIHAQLRHALYEATQHIREADFEVLPLKKLVEILENGEPANPADLNALVLSQLDDFAVELKSSNADIFRNFWNNNTSPRSHRGENECRDFLLVWLKSAMQPFRIDVQPEADFFNDKRADIRISFGASIALPIEIKGEWHKDLWNASQSQLISQYTSSVETGGYGIYLVLWFGGQFQLAAKDGGNRPSNAKELEQRLSKRIPVEKSSLITVKVLDVSWPRA